MLHCIIRNLYLLYYICFNSFMIEWMKWCVIRIVLLHHFFPNMFACKLTLKHCLKRLYAMVFRTTVHLHNKRIGCCCLRLIKSDNAFSKSFCLVFYTSNLKKMLPPWCRNAFIYLCKSAISQLINLKRCWLSMMSLQSKCDTLMKLLKVTN